MSTIQQIFDLLPAGWTVTPEALPGTYLQAVAPWAGPYRSNVSLQPGITDGTDGPSTVDAIHDAQLRTAIAAMTDGLLVDHRNAQLGDREGLCSVLAVPHNGLVLTSTLWTVAAEGGPVIVATACAGDRFVVDGEALEEFVEQLPFDELSGLRCPA